MLPPTIPFYAIGTLRRGNLWETTAMPEIREQAYDVAGSVVRALHGETRRRPVDPYGLTLTTNRKAAAAYNQALGRLLRLQDGVETGLEAAVAADPGFAQAHAALALLGHEWGAVGSWRQALQAAHAAAADRHLDDREVSFLDAVTTRLRSDEETGAAALLRHIRLFPRDALAVSVAVPTVAFGGLTSGRQTAQLVEGLGRTYGDDWWYAGQLAFVRQDQERWGEAEELASYALSVEPSSGHAVHARAHVYYETGQHTEGLAWLDGWIQQPRARGQPPLPLLLARGAARADAVRRRRRAPPLRARAGPAAGDRLAGAGRQRRRCCGAATSPAPGRARCRARPCARRHPTGGCSTRRRRSRPCTPRSAWPTEGDDVGLAALRTIAHAHHDPAFRDVVAPLCGALQQVVEGEFAEAAERLTALLPRTGVLGGSMAQREVLEDTLVYALAQSGQGERAAEVLDHAAQPPAVARSTPGAARR